MTQNGRSSIFPESVAQMQRAAGAMYHFRTLAHNAAKDATLDQVRSRRRRRIVLPRRFKSTAPPEKHGIRDMN